MLRVKGCLNVQFRNLKAKDVATAGYVTTVMTINAGVKEYVFVYLDTNCINMLAYICRKHLICNYLLPSHQGAAVLLHCVGAWRK